MNTAIEADDTHAGLRAAALAALQSWKRNIVSLIEAGKAAKEFRADIDAEAVALTLIALIEGAVMISKLTGNPKHRKAVMPAAEKLILDLA